MQVNYGCLYIKMLNGNTFISLTNGHSLPWFSILQSKSVLNSELGDSVLVCALPLSN